MDLRYWRLVPVCLILFAMPALPNAPRISVHVGLKPAPLPALAGPRLLPGPLDGELTSRAAIRRRPIAVMVDNYSPSARPAFGLGAASVVFETLSEGGITRFMALYLERDASRVGPIRSTRVYFDRWAAAFHGIFAHVGGNDDAQDLLWRLPTVFNVDEGPMETPSFSAHPANPFSRSARATAPYNVYVDTRSLRRLARRRGQDWRYAPASLPHREPAPLRSRRQGLLSLGFLDPLATYIPADPAYRVTYHFDRTADTYARIMGGKRQYDAATGKALRVANVVVMFTPAGIPDFAAGWTADAILLPAIGRGTAWFFRDGTAEQGSWQQKDDQAPLRFLDRCRRAATFNPGQTWVEVVPAGSSARWTFPPSDSARARRGCGLSPRPAGGTGGVRGRFKATDGWVDRGDE